jgi:hypothetical protein
MKKQRIKKNIFIDRCVVVNIFFVKVIKKDMKAKLLSLSTELYSLVFFLISEILEERNNNS